MSDHLLRKKCGKYFGWGRLVFPVIAAVAVFAAIWSVGAGAGFLRKHSGQANETVEEGEIYFAQGHLVKMESSLNEKMIAHASNRFSYIYETYLKLENIRPYLSVIPDKNYYLTEDPHPRALDYDALIAVVTEENPFMDYIDITDLLSPDDFYVTDCHWRQEKIADVAERIAEAMGASLSEKDAPFVKFEKPFYGAYYLDGEDRVDADSIYYLDSEILRSCTVRLIGEDGDAAMYDLEKGETESPYDLFLSGAAAMLTIENPGETSGKKLILFRDSFGSSFAPLLVSGYESITLIDIRYVQSFALKEYVDFSGADVLFLYSTLLLNNSLGMK